MSEFEMQGLEVDFVALLWGGDLVFREAQVVTRSLLGTKWCEVSGTGDPQASADDLTRAPADFDSISTYLVNSGVRSLD